MKKIVKISMLVLLALLGLGLAGCDVPLTEYDGSGSYGRATSYRKVLENIRNGEYTINLVTKQEAVDFVETISDADLANVESIDYSETVNGYAVLIKFGKSPEQSGDSSLKIEEKIIEKDGKKYRVTVEEIVEDPVEEVAKKAVEETAKSGE